MINTVKVPREIAFRLTKEAVLVFIRGLLKIRGPEGIGAFEYNPDSKEFTVHTALSPGDSLHVVMQRACDNYIFMVTTDGGVWFCQRSAVLPLESVPIE